MKAYLQTIHDNTKSFYKKATLTDELKPKTISLVSYKTVVAELKNNTVKINGWYSTTTARHINEFLLQNGFNKLSKKEMIQCPTIRK